MMVADTILSERYIFRLEEVESIALAVKLKAKCSKVLEAEGVSCKK